MSKDEWVLKLGSNLVGTEIDVVLETQTRLYIGEAKHESTLHANSSYVLVHQLIRQYVMARILIELCSSKKEVVTFIIRDEVKGREQAQVEFMIDQCWLKKENILSWGYVRKLCS